MTTMLSGEKNAIDEQILNHIKLLTESNSINKELHMWMNGVYFAAYCYQNKHIDEINEILIKWRKR